MYKTSRYPNKGSSAIFFKFCMPKMGMASQYLGFNKNSAYLIFNLLELYFKQIRMSEASK